MWRRENLLYLLQFGHGTHILGSHMGKSKVSSDISDWSRLTQRIQGRRIRMRPEYVPELVAWLAMIRERYDRTARQAAEVHGTKSDVWIDAVRAKMEIYCEVVDALIGLAGQPWSSGQWEGITAVLSRQLASTTV